MKKFALAMLFSVIGSSAMAASSVTMLVKLINHNGTVVCSEYVVTNGNQDVSFECISQVSVDMGWLSKPSLLKIGNTAYVLGQGWISLKAYGADYRGVLNFTENDQAKSLSIQLKNTLSPITLEITPVSYNN